MLPRVLQCGGLRGAVQRFLSRPTATWAAIALAVALAAPSITTGLSADDWLQSMVARGQHPVAGLPDSRFDLFSFVGHGAGNTRAEMNVGVLPWWTDPDGQAGVLAPAVRAHAPGRLTPVARLAGAHARAEPLWFALALAAVAAFYRRFFAAFGGTPAGGVAWAGGLAALLYAIDDAHGPAVGWVANRNAMIAVAAAMPVHACCTIAGDDNVARGRVARAAAARGRARRRRVGAGGRGVPRRLRALPRCAALARRARCRWRRTSAS